MKSQVYKILFLIFCGINITTAQNNEVTNSKIVKCFSDYYELERENIHLQLNKTVFLNNEKIWFKGYVYNRKKELPFYDTTNIFVVLYDNEGNQVDFKLLLGFNGSFTGFFSLNEKLLSGKYKIHVYTNWMNNFTENESAIFEIDVISQKENSFNSQKTLNLSQVNIQFQPEGDNFFRGNNNVVGYKVSDCNGNPIPKMSGSIIDDSGNITHTLLSNDFGMGKFEITPTEKISKAVFIINDKKFEANLPVANSTGVSLEVNNVDFDEKVNIVIRTNNNSLFLKNNETVFIVFNQDEKINILNANFKDGKNEININYSKKSLFDGINIIRILDKNLNQLAERIIYNQPNLNPEKINFENVLKLGNNFVVNAQSSLIKSNLSVTVLPINSIGFDNKNDVFASFKILPYLNDKTISRKSFIDADNNWSAIDLDLALLNQKMSSANWQDIVINPSKKEYVFDIGLDVKGSVINDIKPEKHNVKLFSVFANLNSISDISIKKEFLFKNLVLKDSTALSLSLENTEDNESKDLSYFATVLNNKRQFFKKIDFSSKKVCENSDKNVTIFELPKIKNNSITNLDEIQIINNKKKLTREGAGSGNMTLRGYKMDFYGKGYFYLLDFVRNKGFEVINERGELKLTTKEPGSTEEPKKPEVYFDDRLLFNFDEMNQVSIEDIDEVYLDNRKANGGQNTLGVIKVYFKKNVKQIINSKDIPFKILNGFKRNMDFKNNEYESTSDSGFENFGIINWIPQIVSDDKGNFKFEIPDTGRANVKIKIEGFSDNGKLISEIRILKLY